MESHAFGVILLLDLETNLTYFFWHVIQLTLILNSKIVHLEDVNYGLKYHFGQYTL